MCHVYSKPYWFVIFPYSVYNPILVFSSLASIIKVSLTVLLLFGGAVDPVVLIGSPNHLKLVKKYLKLPWIWNEWVDVRFTVAGPVLDQIYRSQQKEVRRRTSAHSNLQVRQKHYLWRSFSVHRWSGTWLCKPRFHTARTGAYSTHADNWLWHETEEFKDSC